MVDQPQLLAPAAVHGLGYAVDSARRIARRKSVLLLTPTTLPPPLAASQTTADVLAIDSIIEQYTPPWTMPIGWSSLG